MSQIVQEEQREQDSAIDTAIEKTTIISIIIIIYYYSLPFEGVGVKFIRIFKTNNCQLVYYKDVLELFQVVE